MTASLRPVSRMAAPLMSRSQRWNTTGTKSEAAAPDSAASSKPDASTTTEENNKSLLEEKDKQIVLLQVSNPRSHIFNN